MPPETLLLTLLGGLFALDGTALGQFMVSRPLVAGCLTGWVLGDPTTGLLVGGLLEFYFIPAFPVGGSDFPEGGPPALVAVVGATLLPGIGGVALGVGLGLAWSRLGAFSIHALRKANARLAPNPSADRLTPARVVGGQTGALALDFLRGCGLSLTGLWAAALGATFLADSWPLDAPATLGVLLAGASVPAGAFVSELGGWRKRGVLFAAGLMGFVIGSYLL